MSFWCRSDCPVEPRTKALTAATGIAETVATKIATELPINSGSISADGRINNPHYRVLAALINGDYLDIGLDGAEMGGNMYGLGTGGPVASVPNEAYRQIAMQPDLQEKLLALIREAMQRSSTQPAP